MSANLRGRLRIRDADHTHLSANPPSRNCFARSSATRYVVLESWRALLNRMLSFAMSSGDSIEADIRETPLWITFHYWDGVTTVDARR